MKFSIKTIIILSGILISVALIPYLSNVIFENLQNYQVKSNGRKILLIYTGGTIGMGGKSTRVCSKETFSTKKIKIIFRHVSERSKNWNCRL